MVAAYAVTMLAMGFLHRPIDISEVIQQDGPDLSAFLLPDGSPPPLCAAGDGQAPPAHHHFSNHCDACLLSAHGGLPANGGEAVFALLSRRVSATWVTEQVPEGQVHSRPFSRGPPPSLIQLV
jgi:hypothetical protein